MEGVCGLEMSSSQRATWTAARKWHSPRVCVFRTEKIQGLWMARREKEGTLAIYWIFTTSCRTSLFSNSLGKERYNGRLKVSLLVQNPDFKWNFRVRNVRTLSKELDLKCLKFWTKDFICKLFGPLLLENLCMEHFVSLWYFFLR